MRLSHKTHRFVDWVLSAPFLLACIPLSSCTRQGPYSWWSHLCLCQTPWTPRGALNRRCTDGWVRELERFIDWTFVTFLCVLCLSLVSLVCSLLWCCSTECVCVCVGHKTVLPPKDLWCLMTDKAFCQKALWAPWLSFASGALACYVCYCWLWSSMVGKIGGRLKGKN